MLRGLQKSDFRPKGVPLTHGNLAASIENIKATYDMSPTDRTIIVMPLFHVHGLMCALLSTLSAGGAVVLPAGGKFSATTFWDDIISTGVTWYTAVPTIHQILLSRQKSGADDEKLAKLQPLRFIRSCSAALAPSILHELEAAFKAPVLEAYASELAFLGTSSLPNVQHLLAKRSDGSLAPNVLQPPPAPRFAQGRHRWKADRH